MATAIPGIALPVGTQQSQVGFVNESGWLQRLPRSFPLQLVGGQPAQLIIDQRQKPVGRTDVPVFEHFRMLVNSVIISRYCQHAEKEMCGRSTRQKLH